MDEPEWKKLSTDGKLDHLHELLHALIRHVDDIGMKVNRLQQRLGSSGADAAGERRETKE